jgi:hypothetical protein
MVISPSFTIFSPSFYWLLSSGRPGSSSKLERIMMGNFGAEELLTQVDSAIDIFEVLSKGNFKALFLFDNAPGHQKWAVDVISAQKMVKGVPIFPFTFFTFYLTSIDEGLRKDWTHHQVGCVWDTVTSQTATRSHFTSWTSICPCLVGSKAWSKSSGSVAYGQLRGSLCSVQTSAAPLDVLIAAVSSFFFHSRTSPIASCNFKNSPSRADISATFTPSTIAS